MLFTHFSLPLVDFHQSLIKFRLKILSLSWYVPLVEVNQAIIAWLFRQAVKNSWGSKSGTKTKLKKGGGAKKILKNSSKLIEIDENLMKTEVFVTKLILATFGDINVNENHFSEANEMFWMLNWLLLRQNV